MTKLSEKQATKGRFSFPAIEPEELMFALQLGDAAATLKMPVENPALQGIFWTRKAVK